MDSEKLFEGICQGYRGSGEFVRGIGVWDVPSTPGSYKV